jgi:hypothetical protein
MRTYQEAEITVRFGMLVCPSCDSTYLHHGTVSAFARREDDPKVILTVVGPRGLTSQAAVPNEDSGNPSVRRHGLLISFECENCDAHLSLALAQHKGETEVLWRIGGRNGG